MGKNDYFAIREQDPYSQTETSVLALFHENSNAGTINSI
jgi:hypothetical protein